MLDREKFIEGFEHMRFFFRRNIAFTERALDIWHDKIKHLHPFDFQAAIESVTSEEKQFPTPDILLRHAEKARERRGAREQSRANDQARQFFDHSDHKPGMGTDCRKFIEKLFAIPRGAKQEKLEAYAKFYRDMAKKYGGAWRDSVGEAEAELERFKREKDPVATCDALKDCLEVMHEY